LKPILSTNQQSIMSLLLFEKVCLYKEDKNVTILYGQYKHKFDHVEIESMDEVCLVFCENRPDFYLEIPGKITKIERMFFHFQNEKTTFTNLHLTFPFEHCNLDLKPTSAIISTLCKYYTHRLDEWIQYHLNLGFSGIVIFNNDGNVTNGLNESLEHCTRAHSTEEVCRNYPGKVWAIDYPYSPMHGEEWNTIQRISLHIGVNAFQTKCRNIALIDADEFIHLPKNPSMKIEEFLGEYDGTITMKSNILTNKRDDDYLNNNILQLALYVGEDKYTKTILHTDYITENEFIITPHEHPLHTILEKDDIIHYHCWMNRRYEYRDWMPRIDFLHH